MAKEKNPFDVLSKFIDAKLSYDENAEKIRKALSSGKLGVSVVSEILISASVMPALAAENIMLREELDKCLSENTALKKELAIRDNGVVESSGNIVPLFAENGNIIN